MSPSLTAPRRSRPGGRVSVALLLLASTVTAFVLFAASREEAPVAAESRSDPSGITLAALAGEPARFAGREVAIEGEVDAALLPRPNTGRSFLMGDPDAGVLVVPARPGVVPDDLEAGARVRVRGTVMRVAPDRDEGPDLVPEGGVLERFEGMPSIEVTRVEVMA